MAKKTAEEDGMTIISRHIKDREFSKLYLFTGDQSYLIEQYVKNLANAITDTSPNSMNYIPLKKDGIKYTEIADYVLDVPFFAEKKVVVVWNSKFFKKGNEGMEKIIPKIPMILMRESSL
jgi:DNA polymerase-3 subunit delta